MKQKFQISGRMTDMTTGSPLSLILRFALPLVAASMLQQVFSLTDTMVLGVFAGNQAIAVLGVCLWPVWLQVSVLTNLGQAACLLAAVRFGAKDEAALRRAVGCVYRTAVWVGLLFIPALILLTKPFLRLQNTPEAIFDEAAEYLWIIFLGTVFLLVYNILSSLLRAVGDSLTSFYAILISAVINLGLDVLLVAGFGMGTIGAAAATSVSQVFAAVIYLWKLRSYPVFHLRREELRFDPPLFKEYAGLCLPMMAQSFVIAGGGTYVQACINQYGVDFAAGVSAAGKLFSVLETGAIGLASACASFVSQNVGARQFGRIRSAVRQIMGLTLVVALVLGIGLWLAGPWLLRIYVTADALDCAVEQMHAYCIGLLLMYPMYSLRQTVQSLGNLQIPLLAALLQLAARMSTARFLPLWLGRSGIYYTGIAAWAVSVLLIGFIYPRQLRKCSRT